MSKECRVSREDPASWAALGQALQTLDGFHRHRLEHVSETGSTNDDLKAEWAAPVAVPRIRIADHQLAGRGQAGRSWWDEPGNSLLFSFSWMVDGRSPLSEMFPASLVAGIALHQAVVRCWNEDPARVSGSLWLKWPNDLWWEGTKLGGILVEGSVFAGTENRHLVVGIGVNLRGPGGTLPSGEHRLTLEAIGRPLARPELLQAILVSWLELQACPQDWPRLWTLAAGPFWKRNCEIIEPDGTTWVARPVKLGLDGSLFVETPDGETRNLRSPQRIRCLAEAVAPKSSCPRRWPGA